MNTLILMDQPIYQTNDFTPFALTNLLTKYTKKNKQIFLHFWQYKKTVILGMKDTRTPYLIDGIKVLKQNNYTPVIRNSGGLGIISDPGILNISLIFPQSEIKKISINNGYEKMLALTQKVFPEVKINAFEITHSYCPGTYDLSINGKKFAGLAQLRVKNGISVMMYISVNGDQYTRGEIMRQFYQHALKEKFGKEGYPAVDPSTMATLEKLLGIPFSVLEIKQKFTMALEQFYSKSKPMDAKDWLRENILEEEWHNQIKWMKQRNSIKELTL